MRTCRFGDILWFPFVFFVMGKMRIIPIYFYRVILLWLYGGGSVWNWTTTSHWFRLLLFWSVLRRDVAYKCVNFLCMQSIWMARNVLRFSLDVFALHTSRRRFLLWLLCQGPFPKLIVYMMMLPCWKFFRFLLLIGVSKTSFWLFGSLLLFLG